jgi:hypothetical protein
MANFNTNARFHGSDAIAGSCDAFRFNRAATSCAGGAGSGVPLVVLTCVDVVAVAAVVTFRAVTKEDPYISCSMCGDSSRMSLIGLME